MVTRRGDSGANRLIGEAGDDTLLGFGGDDFLSGRAGSDTLRGGGGRDRLFGGVGDDRLQGQGGSDILAGQAGNDVLIGGADADVFGVLDVRHGLDRIVGFGGGDKIDLRVALPAHGPGDDIADFLRVRPDTGSTIISINPSGEGQSFTDVLRLEGRDIGFYSLISSLQLNPLSASQILAVQEDPYNFENVSDTSADPTITPNGRFVAFTSKDNIDSHPEDITLVDFDTEDQATSDIFVKDFRSGAVFRVSVDADGVLAGADSSSPAISANGRKVAFVTNGALSDLDDNASADVFVKNLATGEVTLVSAAGPDGPAVGASEPGFDESGSSVAMSANGRFVAFLTTAALVPESRDDNGLLDLYVRDLKTDRIFLASMDSQAQAGGVSDPAIHMSGDGSLVAFTTDAALDPTNDRNEQADVYVWNRLVPDSAPVLASGAGQPPSQLDFELSSNPVLSMDGRFVAFESNAALVSDDTNGVRDVYRRDLFDDEIVRVSVDQESRQTATGDSVNPTISADGRFVAFSSAAGDLVLDDTSFGNADRETAEGNPPREDIFVKDMQTGAVMRVSLDDDGIQGSGTSFSPSLSGDARFVSFLTDASNLLGVGGGDSVVLTTVGSNPPRTADIPDNPEGAASVSVVFSDFALRSTIDAAGDHDWFRVSLSEGSFYAFDLEGRPTGQGTLADPFIRILGANGSPILRADGREVSEEADDAGVGRNAHLEFTPGVGQSGDYLISVEGFNGTGTGTYRLRGLLDFDDQLSNTDTDEILILGTPAQGIIRATFDADWYAVQLIEGQSYRFALRSDGSNGKPLTDPFLEIHDAAGVLLTSDDNSGAAGLNALLDFQAPSDGTFFVAASGVREATGDYELTGEVLLAPLAASSPLQLTEVLDANPGVDSVPLGADSTKMNLSAGADAPAALVAVDAGGALANLLGNTGDVAVV
jgi:Tol biopolymer transport system component